MSDIIQTTGKCDVHVDDVQASEPSNWRRRAIVSRDNRTGDARHPQDLTTQGAIQHGRKQCGHAHSVRVTGPILAADDWASIAAREE